MLSKKIAGLNDGQLKTPKTDYKMHNTDNKVVEVNYRKFSTDEKLNILKIPHITPDKNYSERNRLLSQYSNLENNEHAEYIAQLK